MKNVRLELSDELHKKVKLKAFKESQFMKDYLISGIVEQVKK